jgi:hypothetical protein
MWPPSIPILNLFISLDVPRQLSGECINFIRKEEPEFNIWMPVTRVFTEPWNLRLMKPIS